MCDIEEGSKCPECDDGFVELSESENCSCHLSAPCSSCLDRVLMCSSCGFEFYNEHETLETKPKFHEYDYSYRFRQPLYNDIDMAEIDFLYEKDHWGVFGLIGYPDDFGNLFYVTKTNPAEVNWKSFAHSSCSMIKSGWAPPWYSSDEIFQEVQGTFGGRFEFINTKNMFRFIAYTD